MARSKVKICACCALLLLCALTVIVCVSVLVGKKCPEGAFPRAAVAADSGRCSQVGLDILRSGGSAVDGAIAALLCTSLVNPQSMGLGGGTILTVMNSTGHVTVINAREAAPRSSKPRLLDSCPQRFRLLPGVEWVAVPGEIRGYEEAHKLFGRLPWATLFQPTIRLAREGLPIPKTLGRYLSTFNWTNQAPLRNLFSDKDGNLLKTGDVVKFQKLADTLEIIAKDGAAAFYRGPIAADLVHDIQAAGGTLTAEDLAAFRAVVTDAWSVPLGEFQLYFPPPPAGGATVAFIMNILKGFKLNSTDLEGHRKTVAYHRYAEALKFANSFRKNIRDPALSPDSVKEVRKGMEESFSDHIRSLIWSNATHDPQYYNITPSAEGMGTTQVSVLAEDGTAVSATSSLNHIFGSGVFSPRTGIILNNQLADFCRRASRIVPGDRPPSSMAPSVLKSPSKTLVIGSTGGSMIPAAMVSMLMNHLWFGKNLKDSIAAPILFVDYETAVNFGPNFDKDLSDALEALGHKPGGNRTFYNVVNAVEKVDDCIWAVSDARKDGEAAGF
uniref:Glutathione hydrolase n=1 Tax=Tetraodon nigroviridis TaxID=99883 RepID=H3D1N6_TETNG